MFDILDPESTTGHVEVQRDSEGRMEAIRLTSHENGSWRWQSAYAVATYSPRLRMKAGRGKSTMVWASHGQGPKVSMPQARKRGLDSLPFGSLSQRPVTAAILQGLALLEDMGYGRIYIHS